MQKLHALNPGQDTDGLFSTSIHVSATGRFLIQTSPADSDVPLCVIYKPVDCGGRGPIWAAVPEERISVHNVAIIPPYMSLESSVRDSFSLSHHIRLGVKLGHSH